MKFLIASIIGGIIGYLTNWIAIKMLFRPYEEKKNIRYEGSIYTRTYSKRKN